MMIGRGVCCLPQNMAKGTSPGAVIIGWLINGIGKLSDAPGSLNRRTGTCIGVQ